MSKLTPEQQVKQLRTTPTKPGAEDVAAMEARVVALQALYDLAGRSNPGHTMHGLFTGLWAEAPDSI